MNQPDLSTYLDDVARRFESPAFIDGDPVSVVHAFDDPRDQEVIGLFAAILAWGRRDTMLKKLADLLQRFDYRPYRFVLEYADERDGPRLDGFGHRTFIPGDVHQLVLSLQWVLRRHESLMHAAVSGPAHNEVHIGPEIQRLSELLLEGRPDVPVRMRKHLARPSTGSACKRICMYFRWMVRSGPVDLGIWTGINPSRLVLPLDVHSGRQARAIGLLKRKSNDWAAALELTNACRNLCPEDPTRYDFALFGTGAAGETLSLS